MLENRHIFRQLELPFIFIIPSPRAEMTTSRCATWILRPEKSLNPLTLPSFPLLNFRYSSSRHRLVLGFEVSGVITVSSVTWCVHPHADWSKEDPGAHGREMFRLCISSKYVWLSFGLAHLLQTCNWSVTVPCLGGQGVTHVGSVTHPWPCLNL